MHGVTTAVIASPDDGAVGNTGHENFLYKYNNIVEKPDNINPKMLDTINFIRVGLRKSNMHLAVTPTPSFLPDP